jgi:hypothetical protein
MGAGHCVLLGVFIVMMVSKGLVSGQFYEEFWIHLAYAVLPRRRSYHRCRPQKILKCVVSRYHPYLSWIMLSFI